MICMEVKFQKENASMLWLKKKYVKRDLQCTTYRHIANQNIVIQQETSLKKHILQHKIVCENGWFSKRVSFIPRLTFNSWKASQIWLRSSLKNELAFGTNSNELGPNYSPAIFQKLSFSFRISNWEFPQSMDTTKTCFVYD